MPFTQQPRHVIEVAARTLAPRTARQRHRTKTFAGSTALLLVLGALTAPSLAYAASPATINLGSASTFSVVAGSYVTLATTSTVSGDAAAFGAITKGDPSAVGGVTHADNNDAAPQAITDMNAAYADAVTRISTPIPEALGGQILTAGVYHAVAAFSMAASQTVTLDGEGNANAIFILKTDGAIVTGASAEVVLINGAQASNVFWQTPTHVVFGANTIFHGTLLANSYITFGAGTQLAGRALSGSYVSMDAASITTLTVPGAPTGATAVAGNGQAVVSWAAPASNGGSAITGYTVTSSPGGLTATTAGATTATVTGLTNGTAYTFTVTATNTIGTSAASTASTTVTPVPIELTVSRLSGADRYHTAAQISEQFAPGVPVVYLATGARYPDALSAASAAAFQGGPLLLTTPDALPLVIRDELTRLGPAQVVIVGGTGAVSEAVRSQVAALLPTATVRRDSGADRYATSRVIAQRAFPAAGTVTAFIATGADFPDALSASAAAGVAASPVILVNGTASGIDAATQALLGTLGVQQVVIAGGVGVVSTTVENALEAIVGGTQVTRLSGSDRYSTSVAINADRFTSADTVYLATGLGFADALAGAALAGNTGGPLYVVPRACVPADVLTELQRLSTTKVVLLGGAGVLTNNVANLVSC